MSEFEAIVLSELGYQGRTVRSRAREYKSPDARATACRSSPLVLNDTKGRRLFTLARASGSEGCGDHDVGSSVDETWEAGRPG